MDLNGKRALVIGGAGGGIGRAVTRALGRAGAVVAVADLDANSAAEAAAELRASSVPATPPVQVDVTSPNELERMVEEAVGALGGLDVVVTVVGGQVAHVQSALLHEMADGDWDTMYELNLRYVARTLRLVLPRLLDQGERWLDHQHRVGDRDHGCAWSGRVRGHEGRARQPGPNRGGQVLRPGLRMNVVTAGAIATSVANTEDSGVEEIPVGRYGTVEEVAAAVCYLASWDAAYLTGQQIVLDGGVSSRGPFGP